MDKELIEELRAIEAYGEALISGYEARKYANAMEEMETENAALREQLDDAKRQSRQRDAMNSEQAKCIDRLIAERDALREQLTGKSKEIERYQQWVNDLQSGMYVNCVYCGHRYGPADKVPASMAEVLKQHVEQYPAHPMSQLKADIARVTAERDVAIKDIGLATSGRCCKICSRDCIGYEEMTACSSFQWRGLQKEDNGNDD